MVIYDKLKNLETEEEQFNFICPYCKANGMKKDVFTINPLNLSWKPDFYKDKDGTEILLTNDDIENKLLRESYSALPTLKEALIQAGNKNNETNNLLIICNKCNQPITLNKSIPISTLRRWINKNLPSYLNLSVKKEVLNNG